MVRVDPIAVLCLSLLCGAAASAQDDDAAQNSLGGQYAQELFTPGNSAKLALGLLYDQATAAVPQWGSNRNGLARRAEWLTTGYVTRFTTEFAVARMKGVDTSSQRCLCKGFPRRTVHALHAEFTERKRDGSPTFAVARLMGIYVSAVATETMLPGERSVENMNSRAVAAIGIDEGFNMLQEFWPEIRRTLLFRKKPR
jgi:hypothetical protein